MRLLPESETIKRWPSETASRGKLSELLPVSGLELTKSAWPITRSAAAPLLVGIVLKIRTRLLPRSVTIKRVPSLVAETGLIMLLAVGGVRDVRVVKLLWTRTTSAWA